jgi:hypothetical protein
LEKIDFWFSKKRDFLEENDVLGKSEAGRMRPRKKRGCFLGEFDGFRIWGNEGRRVGSEGWVAEKWELWEKEIRC